MIEQAFGQSPAFSLGVEEEVMILDGESLLLSPSVDVLISGSRELELPGQLKTELFASIVELNTDVCGTVAEAGEALAALRAGASEIAAKHGLRIAAAGSHPISDPEQEEIASDPRYKEFVGFAGVSARRQGVSGLHVHVGMPDGETCFRVMETILPWLPLILALSANSPYLEGRDTGMRSIRAEILGILPRHGAPPAFRDYADWGRFIDRMAATGVAADYTSFWWDVRLHPRFGTLEVRAPDQATSFEQTAALVRLIRDLCEWALGAPPREHDPAERGVYEQNRWAASRFGPHGKLIHPDRDVALTVAELMEELPVPVEGLDADACEADRQLEVGEERGLEAVCADLVERSVP
jgi:glutamate---cysteine ligase / carboxylate-amine ligase